MELIGELLADILSQKRTKEELKVRVHRLVQDFSSSTKYTIDS